MRGDNVVLFMVDQLSAKWLEVAIENNICPLDNIKALMSRGTYFKNTITSNAVCCPTRATIATGMTTRAHGVLENGYKLDPSLPTFMKSLQEVGYTTGMLGKLHLAPHFEGFYPNYKAYGFDMTHITEDGRGGEWLDWVRDNYPQHFDNVLATIWPMHIPEYEHYGKSGENLKERIEQVSEKFQWETDEYPQNSHFAYAQPFPKPVCQTEWITSHALDFLRGVNPDKPLFAQISYVQPHSPFNVPGEYLSKVDESKIPEALEAEWITDPFTPKYFKSHHKAEIPNPSYARKCYFADLCHLDEQLGKIIECLKETKRYETTNIIFLSDHGELLGDHGCYGKEERHYDACIRVPLIITGPGLQQGKVCDEMVQHEDICPTILEMAGTQLPLMPHQGPYLKIQEDKKHMFYGKSLIDICQGKQEVIRRAAYSESFNKIDSIEYTDWARTVRTQQFRYTYYADKSGEQLFDLKNDPGEQQNLAGDMAYADVKHELKDELLELLIRQDWPKTRRDLYALGVH